MAVVPVMQIGDFGNPKVISGYARETISGGQFVTGSTANNVVTSGTDSFSTSDVKFIVGGSGTTVTGMALANAVSGALVPVALEGLFIVQSLGTLVAGQTIAASDNVVGPSTTAGTIVGRAITNAGSEGYAVVYLQF